MVKLFCDYDDYNWDFSLFNAVQENIKALRVYIPQIPHVFHLGKSLFSVLIYQLSNELTIEMAERIT